MTPPNLFSPLTLPNGTELPNRLCKAAMEENLAEPGQVPGARLTTLYQRWADGGVGLILTGNVMIDPSAVTGPGGVVLEQGSDLTPFRKWADAGRSNGGHIWMQINHPGRQLSAALEEQAVAASPIGVDLGKYSKMMAVPRALEDAEILEIIERFATTAALAEQAGFTGVQVHAAHGYLINQFLSPLTNKRTDRWGGTPENRARFLYDTVKAVRARVSPEFCVSVKLNSADFQKGGFQVEDAKEVTKVLNTLGLDLLELSGGSYESPAMYGQTDDTSTSRREAFFVDFAREIAAVAEMPIMVTGGIYRKATAIDALAKDEAGFGVDVLGIAKALAHVPDLPNQWRLEQSLNVALPKVEWKNKTMAGVAISAIARRHLVRLSNGKKAGARLSPALSLAWDRMRAKRLTKRYKAWRAKG
jgi:2,4-dienoyl-CoA reductase-like NADH-dependent reductase (Old Yellow Enzyme family)